MKDELGTLGAAVGAVVLACLFGGLVLAIYPGWGKIGAFLSHNLLLDKDVPAWIQAVGSIAAIVGTWWATKHQVASAERVRSLIALQREFDLARASLQVSTKVHRLFRRCKRNFSNGTRPSDLVSVSELEGMLSTVDLIIQQSPPGVALGILIDVRMQLTESLVAVKNGGRDEFKTLLTVMQGKWLTSRARWTLRCHVRQLSLKILVR